MQRRVKPGQRGAGTLSVIAMLMLIAAITVLYLDRHLLLEHQTSAHQWRATVALEAAEAGLSWVQERLNDPRRADSRCLPSTDPQAGEVFRDSFRPRPGASTRTAACQLTGSTLDCRCPAGAADFSSPEGPRLAVRLSPEIDAPAEVLRAQAMGCTWDGAACNHDQTPDTGADARARLSVALRPVPLLPRLPGASLTCGRDCALSGQASLRNERVSGLGVAALVGGTLVGTTTTRVVGLPGAPPSQALIENDASLAASVGNDPACRTEALFARTLGQGLANYAAAPTTRPLQCPADGDCGPALRQAYESGWRAFYLPRGGWLSATALDTGLGRPEAPVALVASGSLTLAGDLLLHGLVFADRVEINANDGGKAKVLGAVIACSAYRQGGLSEVSHEPDVLLALQTQTRVYQRIPGSWRDAP